LRPYVNNQKAELGARILSSPTTATITLEALCNFYLDYRIRLFAKYRSEVKPRREQGSCVCSIFRLLRPVWDPFLRTGQRVTGRGPSATRLIDSVAGALSPSGPEVIFNCAALEEKSRYLGAVEWARGSSEYMRSREPGPPVREMRT
jgi:hypothetical protein